MNKKITVPMIMAMKERGEAITVLTAYDCQMASILDECGVDVLLVGDSLGNVVYGFTTTLPVTMDMMIAHTGAVVRGSEKALVVADMPFMSYQVSLEEAVRNAGRMVKEGGAEAVKLEGGRNVADRIKGIVAANIPVMGHVGLKPQSVNTMGGYRVQGRDDEGKKVIIDDALAVEEAGAFAVVLEGIPASLGAEITEKLSIPTIGIGAGPGCDGQVLVVNDLLGLSRVNPSFVRNYASLSSSVSKAVSAYIDDVRGKRFPSTDESFS